MVVTMHKMTSAHGVEYLLKSVAVGDGDRRLDSPMTRYYTDAGTTDTLRLAISEYTSLIHEYETIAAHAVSIGIARWPRHNGMHRTRIADFITIPEGRLPEDYSAALRQREQAITAAAREQARAAVTAREPWTHGRSRTLEAMTIYRAKYGITAPEAVAVPPDRGNRAQALDYQLALRALPVESPFTASESVGAPRWLGSSADPSCRTATHQCHVPHEVVDRAGVHHQFGSFATSRGPGML